MKENAGTVTYLPRTTSQIERPRQLVLLDFVIANQGLSIIDMT
jgi:hypothetical protein